MVTQVFNVIGTWGEADAFHIYSFTDPDEAINFVELVQTYEREQRALHPKYTLTAWAILTETPDKTAAEVLAFHKAWMEE